MSNYGWFRENGQLKIKWDTEENITTIEKNIAYLTNGCKCKTGCSTRRCGCKKGNMKCGPSCHCVNCVNSGQQCAENSEEHNEILDEILDEEEDGEYDTEVSKESEEQEEEDYNISDITHLMEEIFGISKEEQEEMAYESEDEEESESEDEQESNEDYSEDEYNSYHSNITSTSSQEYSCTNI